MKPITTLANMTTDNKKVLFVPANKPHLSEYVTAYIIAGWPYKEVQRVITGLSESSLYKGGQ